MAPVAAYRVITNLLLDRCEVLEFRLSCHTLFAKDNNYTIKAVNAQA